MGSSSTMNPEFKNQIFRIDQPLILACDRHLAVILPVALRYQSAGVLAGTVVARNTTDGVYDPYSSGGSSGLNAAAGITMRNEATVSGDTVFTPVIFKGIVYYNNLIGVDATAIGSTGLNGRKITDGTGDVLLMF